MRKILTLAAVLSAFAIAVPAASAAGMSGKFCLKEANGKMNCQYETMAACNKAKTGAQTCVASSASTTGSGMSHGNTQK